MPTAIQLTEAQLQVLRDYRNQVALLPPDYVGAWSGFYEALAKIIRNQWMPLGDAPVTMADVYQLRGSIPQDQFNSMIWLVGGQGVNSNFGAFSSVIRLYNIRQGQLRTGITFSESILQEASNEVGKRMADQILGTATEPGNGGKIPNVDEIGERDLTGVRDVLYPENLLPGTDMYLNQAWPGIVMLGVQGGNFLGRLLGEDGSLSTLKDIRELLFSWESFRYAFDATCAGSLANAQNFAILVGIGNDSGVIALLGSIDPSQWAKNVFNMLTQTQNGIARDALGTIADIGSEEFLSMLQRTWYGTSWSFGDFTSNALDYFSTPGILSAGAGILTASSDTLTALAHDDIAVRNALASLSVIKLELPDYSGRNLELYSADHEDGLTDKWLAARSKFLEAYISTQAVGNSEGLYEGFYDSDLGIGLAPELVASSKNHYFISSPYGGSATGSSIADEIYGGSGNDFIQALDGDNYIEGGAGNDVISTGNDSDRVYGGSGTDNIKTEDGDDTVYGGTGNDRIDGGDDDDYLYGDAANPLEDGGDNDVLIGGEGDDTIFGGAGVDTIYGDQETHINTSDPFGLFSGDDKLFGNAGKDLIYGGSGDDELYGGDDGDLLVGGNGTDKLYGGDGNDVLDGEDDEGGDVLEGGDGFDTYYADDGDTIRDSDGQGTIFLHGKKLNFAYKKKGDSSYKDAAGNQYVLNGSTLEINDPLTIENFTNGSFGIYLDEEEDDPTPPPYNPSNSKRWIDPLALDLNGDGKISTISSSQSSAYFDFNGDTISERTGWISEDGFLALDNNGNGIVDGLSELFGNASLDGFDDLRRLDVNNDGLINAQDTSYAQLLVWQDGNADGISQVGELHNLSSLGIQSISLLAQQGQTPDGDNIIGATARFVREIAGGGVEEQLIADVQFAINFALTDSNPNRPLGVPPDLDANVFFLPWLRGFGDVKSLHVAYQEDIELREAAASLVAGGLAAIGAGFESFLVKWSGLEAAHEAAGVTRSELTLEDKVWILEAFTGQHVDRPAIESYSFLPFFPTVGQRLNWDEVYIETRYQEFLSREYVAFSIQALTRDWDAGFSYSLNNDRFFALDLTKLQTFFETKVQNIQTEDEARFIHAIIDRLVADGVHLNTSSLNVSSSAEPAIAQYFNWNNVFYNGAKSAYVLGSSGRDLIDGGAGNDSLVALEGNDWLRGGLGHDNLQGGEGNDILDGGEGNDTLDGGSGSDIYLFGKGSNSDQISSYDIVPNKVDVIQIKSGTTPAEVLLTRLDDDLILRIGGTTDQLRIKNYFLLVDGPNPYSIEKIRFEDGNVSWVYEDVVDLLSGATEGADLLYGYSSDDLIEGLNGDDSIFGRMGNDSLVGGGGRDLLYGQEGNDSLTGGMGNDRLDGGSGNDIYYFGRGDGIDTISSYDTGVGKLDALVFRAGISPQDVVVRRDANDLVLKIVGASDQITVQNYFYNEGGVNPYGLEFVHFEDLSPSWSSADIYARSLIASESNDRLWGNESDNLISGFGGDDFILGLGGDDSIAGGSGSDLLDGGFGSDIYIFGLGDGQDTIRNNDAGADKQDIILFKLGISSEDILVRRNGTNLVLKVIGTPDQITVQDYFYNDDSTNPYRVDLVQFEGGSPSWSYDDIVAKASIATSADDILFGSGNSDQINDLEGNDTIYGLAGDDILTGGNGADVLDGGLGSDIYVFQRGDRQDVINNADRSDSILFKVGVGPQDVTIRRVENDLVLSITGNQDQITVKNHFLITSGGSSQGVGEIKFEDGSPSWSYTDIFNLALIPTSGNDYLGGDDSANIIDGEAGDDILFGAAGDDILSGGVGNDRLNSGLGNDTYIFKRGDGQDIITGFDETPGKQDVILLGTGIQASDIALHRAGFNLVLKISGTADQITVENYFADAYGSTAHGVRPYGIDQIAFEDEDIVWTQQDIQSKVISATESSDYLMGSNSGDTIEGLGGNDSIYGYGGQDVLRGGNGDDRLDGGADNDFLEGGSGDDELSGGLGNDKYIFGRGDGQDQIDAYAYDLGSDVILFKSGISSQDLEVRRNKNDLVIKVFGTADQITVRNYFSDFLGYRIDTIQFEDGSPSWDYLDIVRAVFLITDGDDYLVGDDLGNIIDGSGGDDIIEGAAGNDILKGGSGNDQLVGGIGSDVYIFGRGDGQDTINNLDSSVGNLDSIFLKSNVNPEDVLLRRVGNNLVLKIIGTDDQIVITNHFYVENGIRGYAVDRIQFEDGSPHWSENDILSRTSIATEDSDYLVGSGLGNTISGLGGNDHINGGAGDDVLLGGAGDDLLEGGSGRDTFDGGQGNDRLWNGEGNDIFLFGRGDGQDTIQGTDFVPAKQDSIRFKPGISPEDIQVIRNGTRLTLRIIGTTDEIVVPSFFWTLPQYKVELIQFDNGVSWGYDSIVQRALIPTNEGDELIGTDQGEMILGLGGNDVLQGHGGQDTLVGGEGADTLDGGADSDTYLFNIGDGQDTIISGPGSDILRFGPGVTLESIRLITDNQALRVQLSDTDSVKIFDYWSSSEGLTIQFSDSSVSLDRLAVSQLLKIGTGSDDYLLGGEFSDYLDGLSGNDVILGGGGADTLLGGEGDDTLDGGGENDVLLGGDGSDFLSDGEGNDVIDGGAGDDTWFNWQGEDVFLFGRGDGLDTISGSQYDFFGDVDILRFKEGITPDDIVLEQYRNHQQDGLLVRIRGTVDAVDMQYFFNVPDGLDRPYGVELFQFSDGTTWNYWDIKNHLPTTTPGNDILHGNHFTNDELFGGAGDDYLNGYDGADILEGGIGNDTLVGDWGSDTYVFARGDGQDVITIDYAGNQGKKDAILFRSGITSADLELSFTEEGGLTIFIKGTDDYIRIAGQPNAISSYVPYGIEEIHFEDGGEIWTTSDMLANTHLVSIHGQAEESAYLTVSNWSGHSITGYQWQFSSDGGGTWSDLAGQTNASIYLTQAHVNGQLRVKTTLDSGGAPGLNFSRPTQVIANINNAPSGTVIITGTAIQGQTLNASDSFGDLDGLGTVSYQWQSSLDGASWTNISGATGANLELGQDQVGHQLRVVATYIDGFGTTESVSSGLTAQVEAINTPPVVIQSMASINAVEDIAFSYVIPESIFSDPNDVLTYSVSLASGASLPSWLSFNQSTLSLTGTPPNTAAGQISLRVMATDAGGLSVSTTFALDVANHIQGTASNDTLTGTAGVDYIEGLAGADTINGGAGADALLGGIGNDTYVIDNAGDVVTERVGEGTDLVQASVSYALADNVESLTLTGTAHLNGMGNSLANTLTGNSGNNILDGGAGADTMIGGAGNDTYIVDNTSDAVTESSGGGTDLVLSSVTYTLGSNVENLTLTGTDNINVTGNTLANVLTGNSGNNVLSGGSGSDVMIGGAGDDTYVVDATGDDVMEQTGEGKDLVQSSVTYTLTANVENLTLTGTTAINGTGNSLDNILTGNSANNRLTGGAGNDTIDGGAGNDTMLGGLDNDTYVVNSANDIITEIAGEGIDTILSSVTFTLGNNVENLTLTGSSVINGTGNALDNVLTGNSGANTLSGGTGADRMVGGAGNDTYVVDNAGDIVVELAGEGTDLIQSSMSWTLGSNVENLAFTGSSAINGTGNELANTLTGNSGNNILDGGLGADTLVGGAGNDTYIVDNAGDVVVEATSAGTDLVQSNVTYTLASNVENLTLTGTGNINGTGNTAANVLLGNTGNNTLSGGSGNDTMAGGAGDDIYVVDATGDVVTENAGEGMDTLQSSVTWTLGNNLENLLLTGSSAINGTGNALDNILTGNSGNNTLIGGAGNDILDGGTGTDKLLGGLGNDTYIVDSTTDTLTENAGEGSDTVKSSVTYTLGNNLENLTLTGTSTVNGTGNTLNNALIGNNVNNTLTGAAGNDVLDGSLGSDTLIGGTGNDTYILGLGYGNDTIQENDTTAGNTDVATFLSGIGTDQLWFRHVGNNLEVSVIGTTDIFTVQNWYSAPANHVEQFRTADGHVLLNTKVETLVQAMAAFSPPAAGQTTLPPTYQAALAPVLSANWQ